MTLKKDGNIIPLNKQLMQNGFGQYAPNYAQHPDSVAAFKPMSNQLKKPRKGIWRNPEKIDTKYLRAEVIGESSEPSEAFPLNINYGRRSTAGSASRDKWSVYRCRTVALNNGIGSKTMQKIRPNVVLEEP